MFRWIPSELNVLLILTAVTLSQLQRHRTVSVRDRVLLNGVKVDFLKPEGLLSSKAILAKTRVALA